MTKGIYFADPPQRRRVKRSSRGSKWDKKLQAVKDELGTGSQDKAACIGQEMSYSNSSSTASAIRNGAHGKGWLATFLLDEDVEPIERPDEHPEFKHYSVWVAYKRKYTGDLTVFE